MQTGVTHNRKGKVKAMEAIKRHKLFALLATGALLLFGAILLTTAFPAAAQTKGDCSDMNAAQTTGNSSMMGTGSQAASGMGSMDDMTDMMSNIDRHFIEMMVPHHQDAIDMADLALQKATRPEIRTLAENIKRTQTLEVAQMRGWYKEWYGTDLPARETGTAGSNDSGMMSGMMSNSSNDGMMSGQGMMGGMMSGMMGNGDMDMSVNLNDLANAKDFDKAFIEAMLPHHQMALMMSGMVLTGGEHKELNDLARTIITSQSAEIEQMQTLYKQWYGTGTP